jgi:hypothetical protein
MIENLPHTVHSQVCICIPFLPNSSSKVHIPYQNLAHDFKNSQQTKETKMTDQNIRKKPFEDRIIEEVAENVAEEMMAEIQDEVAVWVENLPITSTKVRSTHITKAFQGRFAQQLIERQEHIAQQIVLRGRQVLEQIPTGRVPTEIIVREAQAVKEIEWDFDAHVRRCFLLASKILTENIASENRGRKIVGMVEREVEVILRLDKEKWMEMGG